MLGILIMMHRTTLQSFEPDNSLCTLINNGGLSPEGQR